MGGRDGFSGTRGGVSNGVLGMPFDIYSGKRSGSYIREDVLTSRQPVSGGVAPNIPVKLESMWLETQGDAYVCMERYFACIATIHTSS